MSSMATGGSGLVVHLADFAAALRERGVAVTLSDAADGLAALTLVDLGDRAEVRLALKTALKIRPRDGAAFDELFDLLWSGRAASSAKDRSVRAPRVGPSRRRLSPVPVRQPEDALETPRADGEEPGYSPEAVLRRKPFDDCTPRDLRAMERLLRGLARRLATRPSRRLVPAHSRGTVDLRRSFRRALAHGGELVSLPRRARKIEVPRLTILCDTSGSMDPHARFLLGFVLALRRVARASEVYAFNTSLVRLTPHLKSLRADFAGRLDRAVERLTAQVPDWSGGTRIGECLAEFAARELDLAVDGRTTVLILSDGLDRGDVQPLAQALRAVRARARRVYWLNPLAGDPRYEPTARAMAAALPYVDRLLPAHNLESLGRLVRLLSA